MSVLSLLTLQLQEAGLTAGEAKVTRQQILRQTQDAPTETMRARDRGRERHRLSVEGGGTKEEQRGDPTYFKP